MAWLPGREPRGNWDLHRHEFDPMDDPIVRSWGVALPSPREAFRFCRRPAQRLRISNPPDHEQVQITCKDINSGQASGYDLIWNCTLGR